jgi:AcrR family transcriptional regulator
MPGRRREAATDKRRREILAAALHCYATLGYQRTTMADLRARAGASTGSIYHHFKSKEHLFASLYLEGIRQTQSVLLAALEKHRGAEHGVRAVVAGYLDWVARNRELAAYLVTSRGAEFMESAERELDRLNHEAAERVEAWMQPHVEAGEIPRLPADLYLAVLIGPSDHFARQWLRGKTVTDVSRASRQLAKAAWAALQSFA